jgi:hypothetical protein
MMRGAIHSPDRVAAMAVLKRLERFGPDGHNCFPRGITFSDIDGVVEMAGEFLFLEVKRKGQDVSVGQAIMLRSLAVHHTVCVVWLDKQGEVVQAAEVGDAKIVPETCTEQELADYFTAWADARK